MNISKFTNYDLIELAREHADPKVLKSIISRVATHNPKENLTTSKISILMFIATNKKAPLYILQEVFDLVHLKKEFINRVDLTAFYFKLLENPNCDSDLLMRINLEANNKVITLHVKGSGKLDPLHKDLIEYGLI